MKMKNYLMLILICMSLVATAQRNSGSASFIGDKFHGLKMANGETYNKEALVAGHRTLPYGTKVKVTNTNNSLSVIVTIKDRGPFVKNGIIEVSRKAGETIGMTYNKTAPVRIDVVGAGETVVETETKPVSRSTTTIENTTKGGGVSTYNKPTKKPTKPTSKPAKPKRVVKTKPAKTTKTKTTTGTAKTTNKNTGVYKVAIQNVEKSGYGIQIGVFNDINTVIYKVKKLSNRGFTDIYYTKSGNGYKIILKNFSSHKKATAYKKALKNKYGISGFVVEFSAL